jgi:hypothetical protein
MRVLMVAPSGRLTGNCLDTHCITPPGRRISDLHQLDSSERVSGFAFPLPPSPALRWRAVVTRAKPRRDRRIARPSFSRRAARNSLVEPRSSQVPLSDFFNSNYRGFGCVEDADPWLLACVAAIAVSAVHDR